MMTVGTWLKNQGRDFPAPDADGCVTMAQYQAARLPMVVACTDCTMTMALTPERACDEQGRVYCADCAESHGPPPTLEQVAAQVRAVIARAEADGLIIDDGNVVDLLADNITGRVSLSDLRSAIVVAGLAARFPRATTREG